MACRNKRRWFVIDYLNNKVYGYKKNKSLGWVINIPWVRPYLFKSLKDAQQIADANKSSARIWQGKLYENRRDDNVF